MIGPIRSLLAAPFRLTSDAIYEAALLLDMFAAAVEGVEP